MTLRLQLSCDARFGLEHTPCAARFHRTGHTPAQLTDAAKAVGWHVGPDGDWCPNHRSHDEQRISA